MSLYRPFFNYAKTETAPTYAIRHNLDGSLGFCATEEVDEKTARLLDLAIEEGKRRRSLELLILLKGGE